MFLSVFQIKINRNPHTHIHHHRILVWCVWHWHNTLIWLCSLFIFHYHTLLRRFGRLSDGVRMDTYKILSAVLIRFSPIFVVVIRHMSFSWQATASGVVLNEVFYGQKTRVLSCLPWCFFPSNIGILLDYFANEHLSYCGYDDDLNKCYLLDKETHSSFDSFLLYFDSNRANELVE